MTNIDLLQFLLVMIGSGMILGIVWALLFDFPRW